MKLSLVASIFCLAAAACSSPADPSNSADSATTATPLVIDGESPAALVPGYNHVIVSGSGFATVEDINARVIGVENVSVDYRVVDDTEIQLDFDGVQTVEGTIYVEVTRLDGSQEGFSLTVGR